MLELLLVVVCTFCYLISASPVITWISEPAFPSEAILVLGGIFKETACFGNISTTSNVIRNVKLSPLSNQTRENSMKFVIPFDLAVDVFSFTVTCGSLTSAPYYINAPRPYWIQGDLGEKASAGGWLRVQGLNVAFLTPEAIALRSEQRAVKRLLRRQFSTVATANITTIMHAAKIEEQLVSLHSAAPSTIIRLTPLNEGSAAVTVELKAVMTNATQWSVHIPVPVDLQPGTYSVSLSNGMGPADHLFIPLNSFVSPWQWNVSTITIASPAEVAWAPNVVFVVQKQTLPVSWPWNSSQTSDAAVEKALLQAHAAGGGTVFFPAGTYFLSRPLVIPPNTILAGAGADRSALYFAECTNETAPNAYFQLNDTLAALRPSGTASWGVRDFTLAITGFHYMVFLVSNFTDGFFMDRVVARANAFFASNNAGTIGVPEARSTRGRWANWTLSQPGNFVTFILI